MKNKIRTILLLGFLTVIAVSCSEDHTYYKTAANAEITGLMSEYEAGENITFTCNVVPSAGSTIIGYLWEFGDLQNSSSTDQSPTFAYTKDGTYTVTLTVTDSNELKTKKTARVTITNPTVANFITEKAEYLYGDVVQFLDMSVTKGSTKITGWLWEFADAENSTSTEQNPTFIYNEAGSYPVKLTVTDSYGLVASVTKSVNIIDPSMLIQVQWTAQLGGAVKAGSSPTLSPDGNSLYMLRSKNNDELAMLYSFNTSDGSVAWSKDLSEAMSSVSPTAAATDVFCTPSVGTDGTIYAIVRDLQSTSADRKGPVMLSFNSDGNINWAKAPGAGGTNLYSITPAIDSNGNIIAATRGNEVWKYTPSGDVTIYSTSGGTTGGMTVSKSGQVYGTFNGANGLYSLDINVGTENWVYKDNFSGAADGFTGALRSTTASIDYDGTVYFVIDKVGGGGEIFAIDPSTGQTKWIYDTPGAIPDGGVVISSDGKVYANGGTNSETGLIALDKNGELLWTFSTQAIVQTSPLIDDRGYIHVIDAAANYYVVQEDGTIYAESNLGDSSTSTLVMDNKGRTYAVVLKGGVPTVVCATSRATSYSVDSPWPMRGQNPCRTGLQK